MKDGRDETFEADAVDEYDQAPDHEEAIVESAPDCLKTIEAEGKDTDTVWRLRRQLPGRRSAQSAKKQFIKYLSERWSAKVATDVAWDHRTDI